MIDNASVELAHEMFSELIRRHGEIDEKNIRDLNEKFKANPDARSIVSDLCEKNGGQFIHTNGTYYFLPEVGSPFAMNTTEAFKTKGSSTDTKRYYIDIKKIIEVVILYLLSSGNDAIRPDNEFTTIDTVVAECNKVFKDFSRRGEELGYPRIQEVYKIWDAKNLSRHEDEREGTCNSKQGFVESVWSAGRDRGIFEPDYERSGKIRLTKRCIDLMPYVLNETRAKRIDQAIEEATTAPEKRGAKHA